MTIFAQKCKTMAESKLVRAYKLVSEYKGDNPMIQFYRRQNESSRLLLTEDSFTTDYILKNYNYNVRDLNKTVLISEIYGMILKDKHSLDFIPKKLRITKIIGEMGGSYHCYGQFRQSVPPQLMYVGKKYILTPLDTVEWENLDIDFDKFDKITEKHNRKLKEHQKTAVKFLVANKRCILADSMGLGKSNSAIVAALAAERRKILIITTASLKTTWKREIGYYEPDENVCVINGSTWDGETSKFTVINYDIVQTYYEVPMEPKYTYEEIDNGGKIEKVKVPVMTTDKKTGKLVPKMTKSRKKKDVIKALNNSPLFLSKFDCVIIDEAQKLSNNTSIRYNVISDFLSKSNIEYVFLTTGTPLTNTPINLFHILKLIDAPITSDYNYFVERYCDGKTMMKPGEWTKWSPIYYRNGNLSQKLGDFVKEHAKSMVIPQGSSKLDELQEAIKHLYIRRLSSDIPGMVNKFLDTRVYKLTKSQKEKYDSLWDEYVRAQEENGDNTNEDYRQLVEGTLVRQYLANEMVENTIKLCNDYIEDDEKVVIVCNFTSEIQKFKEYYGKKCVVYDGKMTAKRKDKSEHEFMTNPKIKVFIGQIESAGVGLTLTESRIMIFNSYSWLETSNRQMQDRIYRITQTRDALCIYQLFDDSISRDMFEKVMRKGLVMDTTIKAEKDK